LTDLSFVKDFDFDKVPFDTFVLEILSDFSKELLRIPNPEFIDFWLGAVKAEKE